MFVSLGTQCHALKVHEDQETVHSKEILPLACLAEEADTRLLLHVKTLGFIHV